MMVRCDSMTFGDNPFGSGQLNYGKLCAGILLFILGGVATHGRPYMFFFRGSLQLVGGVGVEAIPASRECGVWSGSA